MHSSPPLDFTLRCKAKVIPRVINSWSGFEGFGRVFGHPLITGLDCPSDLAIVPVCGEIPPDWYKSTMAKM